MAETELHASMIGDTQRTAPVPAARIVHVTVAICTHARPRALARALHSLAGQTATPAEVIVVDNAPPDDATRDLVQHQFPQVRYVLEPVAGLNFARNRVLQEAAQPVVAFLDDDAVADRGWAEAVARVFETNPEVGVCTGRIEALSLASAGAQAFEANGGFSRGAKPIRLPAASRDRLHGLKAPLIAWAVSVGCGCSFAVRRDVAVAIGGFDDALDMGPALPGGGDHDMLWRVLCAGHHVAYEPAALAWHEHRRELESAHEQIIGHQQALIAWLTKVVAESRGRARISALSFLAWRLMKPSVRLLRRTAGRDPLPAGVLWSMWWTCCRALRAYPEAKRLAARRRSEGTCC